MEHTKDTVELRFTISKKLHKELRLMAVEDDTTLQKLIPVLIGAGMAHRTQSPQSVQTSTKRTKGAKGTKRTKDTLSTELTVLPT